MGIWDYVKRTFTYLAGDWDSDGDAVDKLKQWNESSHWGLSFKDVHDLTSSNDTSLNCTIKESLRERMRISKTFVLIVGNHTRSLTSGSCGRCCYHEYRYTLGRYVCKKGYTYDSRGYVDFECDLAVKSGINIIVLYKGTSVDKTKCPDALKDIGIHVAMKTFKRNYLTGGWHSDWDYNAVKEAFDKIN